MSCEDYPCCGHEPGGCPIVDENGNQRFACATCGILMEPRARSAICGPCHRRHLSDDDDEGWFIGDTGFMDTDE